MAENENSDRVYDSILDAATEGDERAVLVAMRTRIAETLDSTALQARDMASLSKRLREITADIAEIDARDAEHEDEIDPDEVAPFSIAAI